MYSRNPFARQFVVSWIALLDNVPDVDMIVFLPELLDGLFTVLGDPTLEIRRMCETLLSEFLCKIIANPSKADFAVMVNILIIHSQSREEIVQFTAITWLKEFVNLAGSTSLLPFSAGLLTAILPCLAQQPNSERAAAETESRNNSRAVMSMNIQEVAKALNYSLMQLVTMEEQHREEVNPLNQNAVELTRSESNTDAEEAVAFELSSIVDVLTRELKKGDSNSTQTKVAVLRWIRHLHSKVPQKITPHLEDNLFPVLLKTLLDSSDDVTILDLEVLAQVFTQSQHIDEGLTSSTYFTRFMLELLNLFRTNTNILEERGAFIIRQLCVLMNSEDIYKSLSQILLTYEDLSFAYIMVQNVNKILFTSSELFELRSQLKDLQTDESCSLFCCLYRTWCHSPVATLSLCLLTKNYKHACDLIMIFGDLDITIEFLAEVDQLVQLIESPVFAFLRLQLLDLERNHDLVKTLYGLLMLLPQSDAFHILRKRLQCVPNLRLIEESRRREGNSPSQPSMDFKELLRHFQQMQEKHQNFQRQTARLRLEDGLSP
ncbi:Protein VAC14 -like protein [Halotydeus destructor]|nr:Protein VAC14 -like protein [Halotydeus destructor]